MLNDLYCALGHYQSHRIAGNLSRAGHNALGVSDGRHLHDVIHIDFRNRPAQHRIGNQIISDDDDFLSVYCIREGISKAAAGRGTVFAGTVACRVCRWRGDKGYVNGRIAQSNIPWTAAMGTKFHGLFHQAFRDAMAQAGRHIVCANLGNHMIVDMLFQRHMYIKDGTGI